MDIKKKKRLKKKPIIFLLILLTVGIVGTTFAYVYSEVVIPNQFKVRTYNVGIEEEFYNEFGTKKVSFVNKEKNGVPVLIRMHYNESWIKTIEEDGETIELFQSNLAKNEDNGEYQEVVLKIWGEDFTDNFACDSDKWCYYNKVLNGEESVQVLENIEANPIIGAEYNGYTYRLIFTVEAIQASKESALRNWNKTVKITGGDVEWQEDGTPS